MDKTINIELHGPAEPPNLRTHYRMMRGYIEDCRDDQALDAVDTAGIRRLCDQLARFKVELVPIHGDEALRPSHGLSGTLIVPGQKVLIWIDGAAYASPALLADALFQGAIHATGRAFRSHEFLPDDWLHPQEYYAEKIVALLGANLVARFVEFDVGPLARCNRRDAVRIHAKYLIGQDWKCEHLYALKWQARYAAMFLAAQDYNDAFRASISGRGAL
ncbi:hypothetical protein [Methylobacterium sp. V23]|uniref:hypothetical protein n=1 Tax=Methylobacterium sp. V23 TaxID=2044878 RepID=UPI000CDA42C4|nr:hypothetical protein [Methylobacterium sp. V23]POR40183.1 hypothetical protein CRT23_25220 [Methylobacterium sp. V23]